MHRRSINNERRFPDSQNFLEALPTGYGDIFFLCISHWVRWWETTTCLAVSSLLYRKSPSEDIRNWRLVSLLSTYHKLLSSVHAARLRWVLNKVIHGEQRGVVDGCYKGVNIIFIKDVLYQIKSETRTVMLKYLCLVQKGLPTRR